jgi:hypothetical protein
MRRVNLGSPSGAPSLQWIMQALAEIERASHEGTPEDILIAAALAALEGTAANDNAAAGQIGEVISSQVLEGSAVALTTSVVANITSISLTPGDWDVRGHVSFVSAATTSVTRVIGGISETTAARDVVGMNTETGSVFAAVVPGAINAFKLPVGPTRKSLATTTTIYLVALGTFTVDTMSAYGSIVARRMR